MARNAIVLSKKVRKRCVVFKIRERTTDISLIISQ